MSREDVQKLLGGYATGTLTPAERDALFAAALEDQELFDALTREEPLRELLQDPIAKSRLTAALQTTRVSWQQRWLRPALLATGVAAIALVAVVALRNPRQPQEVTIAQVAPPPPASPPSALPQPSAPVAEPAPEVKQSVLKKVVPPAAAPADKTKADAAPATRESAPGQAPAVDALTAAAPPPPAPLTPRPAAPSRQVVTLPNIDPRFQALAARNSAPSQDARALFYGAPLQLPIQTNFVRAEAEARSAVFAQAANAPAASSPPPHLGLRYILRRIPPAVPEDLNPSQDLASVDNLQLSLQPNDNGYLYVFERDAAGQWTLRASEQVARMTPYLLPSAGPLAFPPAGNLELFVLFSREMINPEDRQVTPRDDQAITAAVADRAVYVVSTSGNVPSQRLAFPVTLRRR